MISKAELYSGLLAVVQAWPASFAITVTLALFALASLPAMTYAQELAPADQPHRPEFGVYSDTIGHRAPASRVVFTDSRPKNTQLQEEVSSAEPRPEGVNDDFENKNPTKWWVYTHQTVAKIDSFIKTYDARIIDIEVDSFSPYSFTVTYVQNTGTYKKTSWWYSDLTAAQVNSDLAANQARPISIKAYDIGSGKIRFAVAMIANTGVDEKKWWWYSDKSEAEISSLLKTNTARLITLDACKIGTATAYTAIMIADTGVDKVDWWWLVNASADTLGSAVKDNKARVVYLTPGATGNFNAILESCATDCLDSWFYPAKTFAEMVSTATQQGARLLNLASYAGCGSVCFIGARINNSNEITTRVGNLIRNGGIAGTEGLYLKKVNGSVLANLEDGVEFEPASTIKVLANLYSMTQVEKGKISLTTQITHYANGPDSCPDPPDISGTESLGTALREMMYHSDNARTREITDHWTEAAIDAYAASIGLDHTGFHEIVGCGPGTPGSDTLTLDDAGALYEGVATQKFLDAKDRGIFYSNMAGRAQFESEGYDWTSIWDSDIPNIINQVAPAGYTAAQKTAYQNAMNLAYKAGNYVLCTNNECTDVVEDIAIAGWFQLPVCSATGTTYAEYVFGIMFSKEPYSGWTSNTTTPADNNFFAADSELLREQIQAGMTSCLGKSLDVLTWTPADLVFPTTAVGSTSPVQTVTLTNKQLTAASTLSFSIFGDFSYTTTCGSTLAAGKSCTISAQFKPTTTGERTGAVIISDRDTGEPQTIQLTGQTPVLYPP